MKIAVLLGGLSSERNISLLSGRSIVAALRDRGHEVLPLDPSLGAECLLSDDDLTNATNAEISAEELKQFQPRKLMECINSKYFDGIDVAFIALHGKYGEDGVIQNLLELRGIKYTGSGPLASAVAMDKNMSKILFHASGVLTAPWVVLTPEYFDDTEHLREIIGELGKDLVVKPNDQGSTVGMSIVHGGDIDALQTAVREAAKFTDKVIIEKYIAGRELTVPIIGDEAFPIIEIAAEGGFYDYQHKYTKGHTEYICPADLSEDIADFTQNMALTAHRVLGCKALSRVDFRLDEDGQPFCLEVNTIPGFTSTSLVPKSAKEVGIEFGELCERIIELSLNENLD